MKRASYGRQWTQPIGVVLFLALVLGVVKFGNIPIAQEPPAEPETLYLVKRVVDGDTLLMEDGTRVRMLGVNTPEIHDRVEPFGKEADEFTRKHLEGKRVRLEFDQERHDQYGRVLAHVYVGDWFHNKELIRAGLSRAQLRFPYSQAKKKIFQAAETEAKKNQRGLWSPRNASVLVLRKDLVA